MSLGLYQFLSARIEALTLQFIATLNVRDVTTLEGSQVGVQLLRERCGKMSLDKDISFKNSYDNFFFERVLALAKQKIGGLENLYER
jgi:hypothetical protein